MEDVQKKGRANRVLIAGILFNLSIGVLYAWSVMKAKLAAPVAEGGYGWTSAEAGLPYTVAIVCFALGLLLGGIIQDRIGPKKIITIGGFMVGLGLALSSFVGDSVTGVVLTYGVLTGVGIGFGYGCVSPCVFKWFHPSKKGMVAGLVVGGFGIAAVYLAPLTQFLLGSFGISQTFLFLGIFVTVVSVLLAQFIDNPKEGYVPETPKGLSTTQGAKVSPAVDVVWKDMVKTREFILIFLLFLLSSSVGLMVIGNISKIALIQDPVGAVVYSAILVSLLAIFNTGGRVIGGMLSDKIGRYNTLLVVFAIQCANMVMFAFFNNFALLTFGALLVGFSYGTLLSVFPSLTADLYGLKNYGTNYGIVYLAWGLSGVLAPVVADIVYDATGEFTIAYFICAGLMALCIVLGFALKKVRAKSEAAA